MSRSPSLDSTLTVRRPDPGVWREALDLAGGDPHRLEVLPDGTVIVHNKPVR